MDLSDYKNILAKRAEATRKASKKVQATYKQHLAVETSEMLKDEHSLGIYLRLFNRYNHIALIECRDWVLKKGSGNLGRLFVATYKKFLGIEK